jgi:predicted DNA binding CopG/RHH family protein
MKTENNKRMNITLSEKFFSQLKEQASKEHLLPSTYAKQLLMKSLPINNEENKCLTKNGKAM